MSEPYNVDSNIFTREIEPSADLRAALFGGWQDISTAPKDGTRIMTFPHYVITSWNDQVHEMATGESGWVGSWDEDWNCYHSVHPKPTHWMPLPKPPVI